MRFEYTTALKLAQLASLAVGCSSQSAPSSPPTSRFRTANYITHGLPQQCLTNTKHTPTASATSIVASDVRVASSYATANKATKSYIASITATRDTISLILPSVSETNVPPLPSDDPESPLDSVKFLSFEEWKAQNLAKAGQSSENFEQRAAKEPRKRPVVGNNALDALGDDIEIDFGYESNDGGSAEAQQKPASNTKPAESVAPVWHGRSKLAGKTGKERFNYASFDCAAMVHKTNREARGSSSILVENKDSYMLNECRAENKFVIVELCDMIYIDTIALANFEFFSSMFKRFRISVGDKYPVKASGWKELGVYEARNSREIQAFLIENPLIWARYLKVEFLTHYGNEFYCPLSLLRVHGTTMMEEFRAQEEAAKGLAEDDTEEEVPVREHKAPEIASKKPVDLGSLPSSGTPLTEMHGLTAEPIIRKKQEVEIYQPSLASRPNGPRPTGDITCKNPGLSMLAANQQQCIATFDTASLLVLLSKPSAQGIEVTSTTIAAALSKKSEIKSLYGDDTASASSKNVMENENHTNKAATEISHEQSIPASLAAPPQASPTTQESFYKSFHKRLQLLEANATLSLQYIEDQSRAIKDAFTKMEMRHISKTNKFMDMLSHTVTAELSGYKQQYDQLWQSTVIELESQRKQAEREMLAISSRLTLLADEVLYQRRMSWVQSALLLVCILLLIFSKSSHLDAPLIHSIRGRAPTFRILDSPPSSPPLRSNDTPEDSPMGRGDRMQRKDSTCSVLQSPTSFDLSPPPATERASPPAILEPPASISSPATPTGRRSSEVDGVTDAVETDWRVFGPYSKAAELASRQWHRLPSPLTSIANMEDDTDRRNEMESRSSSPSLPPSMTSSVASIKSQVKKQTPSEASPQGTTSTTHHLQKPSEHLNSHSRSNSTSKNKKRRKK